MVLLTTTPQILKLISSLPDTTKSTLTTTLDTLPNDLESPISHQTLVSLSQLSENTNNEVSLNSLLRGTKPYFPPPPPKPEPSPEYKALMTRLRSEQEQREYRALIAQRSQDSIIGNNNNENEEDEEDNISPSLVLNILLSVVFCAIAVFTVSKWIASDGVRVLMSLGTGIIVGIAEVVVYAAYLRKVKESKMKERRKKERKVLIGEYKGEGDEGDAQSVILKDGDVDKSVIWGRGKHGGMRRRVREKWEKEQEKEKEEQEETIKGQ